MDGEPWTVEEEWKLWSLLLVKLALKGAVALGRSGDAVLKRVKRLGLEDDDTLKFCLFSSKLDREGWLRSVEEAFMMLNTGLRVLCMVGLDKRKLGARKTGSSSCCVLFLEGVHGK